jgi:GAF domain-containing protein
VSLHKYGLTFTIAASDAEIATLDAAQYLDGGPCVAAVEDEERLDFDVADLLDEGRWALYARASAAAGVGSSLSMPIMRRGHVVGGVNLYAATAEAFNGRHDELGEALDASAEAAISNADLGFATRRTAAEAPALLADDQDIQTALELITQRRRVDRVTAWEVLYDSAVRAGLSPAAVARALLRHLLDEDPR